MTTAQFAYGNARVRARKSRLLAPAVLVALATVARPDRTIDGWRDLESDADAVSLATLVYKRLTDDYAALVRAYPSAASALQALARLHELENVKLAWRAMTCGAPPERWHSLWRPMGAMATVRLSRVESAASFDQLIVAMAGTPFAAIATAAHRAHPGDLAAAELAFDRWGSQAVVEAAGTFPRGEHAARRSILNVVCERDVSVIERARGSLGASPQIAMRMASVLGEVLGVAALRTVAEWSGEGGAPVVVPRRLRVAERSVNTFAALRRAIRAARRTECARAFSGDPFSLAPAVALLLLREDEVRTLISIAELRARHVSSADAIRVIEFDR